MIDAATRLTAGAGALGVPLDTPARDALLEYLALLGRWNRVYNLTAVRDPDAMIERHLLDSLSIEPWLHGERVIDVGTGGGLPGIPLAVVSPDRHFVLLDRTAKKARFLLHVVGALGLTNVEVVQSRVEAYRPAVRFDTIVSRAFASVSDMLAACLHLGQRGGRVLAMKGTDPGAELSALPLGAELEQVISLRVPGLDAQRHLVELVITEE